MLIKLWLTPDQLETLQHVLADDPRNQRGFVKGPYVVTTCEKAYFVVIKDVKSSDDTRTTPLPKHYLVTLKVLESYYRESPKGDYGSLENPIKTPLVQLSRVLQAIGLFPDKDGEPA